MWWKRPPKSEEQPESQPLDRLPFFELRTVHGGVVRQAPDGRIVHGHPAQDVPPSVLLFIPARSMHVAFLVGNAVRVDGNRWVGDVVSFRLGYSEQVGGITLRHPITARFLCANLEAGGAADASVSLDRTAEGPWERFELQPADDVPEGLAALGRRLQAVYDGVAASGLDEVIIDQTDAQLFLAVAETKTLDAVDRLARRISNDPVFARLLATSAADPWLRTALPVLADWLASGRPVTSCITAGPDKDFLAQAGEAGVIECIGQLLNNRARRQVAPSRRACIIATARNEGIHLLEWIAYHQALGFEHFFICSNDNTDESDAMLELLANAGVITWTSSILGSAVRPQCKAYSHTLQMVPDVTDYAWAAIIDLDEFVALDRDRYGTVDEFLAFHEQQAVDVIALNWRFAGSRDADRWRDEAVARRFPSTVPDPRYHVKSIVRPGHFMHSHPHFPWATTAFGEVFRDAAGRAHAISPFVPHDFDHAWINHYIYRSADEFAWRRTRNRGDGVVENDISVSRLDTQLIGLFLSLRESLGQALMPDPYAMLAVAEQEMDKLLALPGMATARARVIEAFQREIAQVRRMVAEDPRFQVERTPEWQFARELQSSETLT